MSRVKNKDTSLEVKFRKALWARGLRYRLGRRLLGKPDLVFVSAKIAVFIDGCFWHACPIHGQKPKTNSVFWSEKLTKNSLRDQNVNAGLVELGWTVVRFWEHELKDDAERCVNELIKTLEDRIQMARRPVKNTPELIRTQLAEALKNFGVDLQNDDLRHKVLALVPAFHLLRDLGSSLINQDIPAARDRIIFYLKSYPQKIIHGDELMVVSGISEWARRVRELRVELGWSILSGLTAKELAEAEEEDTLIEIDGRPLSSMKPEEYLLMRDTQDLEAAYRWNLSKTIRKSNASVQDKILAFLRQNIGKQVTGEELRYVSGDKTEWARRARELRTQLGWPLVTRSQGRQDLPIGVYVLEEDRQLPAHDRRIPDAVRVVVLQRDGMACQKCFWKHSDVSPSDPRKILELHHRVHHVSGGANTAENLITLCNVHHDEIHALDIEVDDYLKSGN